MERCTEEPTTFLNGEIMETRYETYSISYKNHIYVFGGCKKNFRNYTTYNDMFKLNLKTKIWQKVTQKGTIPSARSSGSSVLYKNFMVIFGGSDDKSYLNDVNFFDLDKETWVDQDINIVDGPEGRYGCSAVVYEDSMIVFGGTGSKETFNDLWSFSFEKLKWNRLEVYSKYVPPKSSYHSMNIKDNFIYVYGGYYETLYYETLSRFELTEQKWDQINYSGTGPKGISSHATVIINDDLWIYGGNRYGYNVPDYFRLDLFSFTFRKFSNEQNPTGIWGHSIIYYDNSIYAFTGMTAEYKETNRLTKFNILPIRKRFWKEFINNEKNSDCKLIVKGREIYGHKLILSQSPYFYEKLRENDVIEIPEKVGLVIDYILLYLYGASCVYEETTIVKLIYSAITLQLEDLETVAYFHLTNMLSSKNLFDILVESVELKLENVKIIGFNYFWQNSKSSSNVNIPENILVDLLTFQKNPKEFQQKAVKKDKFIIALTKFNESKEFSDITIQSTDQKEYKVHKIILDSIENFPYKMKATSFQWDIILKFIYYQNLDFPKNELQNLLDLLRLCSDNNLEQLKDILVDFMITQVGINDVMTVLQHLIQYNIEGRIKEHCHTIISKNQNLMVRPFVEAQIKQNITIQEQEKKIAILIKLVENQQNMIDHLSQK